MSCTSWKRYDIAPVLKVERFRCWTMVVETRRSKTTGPLLKLLFYYFDRLSVVWHDVKFKRGPIIVQISVSVSITVFPIGWILFLHFKKSSNGQVASTFNQRAANEKEGDLPQACPMTCKQQNTLQLTTITAIFIMAVSCSVFCCLHMIACAWGRSPSFSLAE